MRTLRMGSCRRIGRKTNYARAIWGGCGSANIKGSEYGVGLQRCRLKGGALWRRLIVKTRKTGTRGEESQRTRKNVGRRFVTNLGGSTKVLVPECGPSLRDLSFLLTLSQR